jgi:hypothetical protein
MERIKWVWNNFFKKVGRVSPAYFGQENHVIALNIVKLSNTLLNIVKLSNTLQKFHIQQSMLSIVYTKHVLIKSQFDFHFDSKSYRILSILRSSS